MKAVVRMTLDDAPHFTEEQKKAIYEDYPEHERDARTRGVPMLGSGRVFPIAEEKIKVEDFPIPKTWALIGGLDFGWEHPFAAAKLAHDRDSDTVYVVQAWKVKHETPLIHCSHLKPWGDMPWSWPFDGNKAINQGAKAGQSLKSLYEDEGLRMLHEPAQFEEGGRGVEAGLMKMLDRMRDGRFKVFASLEDWFTEFRMYHRKEGVIVKEFDDLMDATRHAYMMLRYAETPQSGSKVNWNKQTSNV